VGREVLGCSLLQLQFPLQLEPVEQGANLPREDARHLGGLLGEPLSTLKVVQGQYNALLSV
jgi:hypothetical protein